MNAFQNCGKRFIRSIVILFTFVSMIDINLMALLKCYMVNKIAMLLISSSLDLATGRCLQFQQIYSARV